MRRKRNRVRTKLLKELIERLKRIHVSDEMTKEDAGNILVGAIAINYKFIRSFLEIEGEIRPPHERIKELLTDRIDDILETMA